MTRFERHDTFCIKRDLGMPAENPTGYRDGSVLTVLPAMAKPLLLVHGMAEDDVLFTTSTVR